MRPAVMVEILVILVIAFVVSEDLYGSDSPFDAEWFQSRKQTLVILCAVGLAVGAIVILISRR